MLRARPMAPSPLAPLLVAIGMALPAVLASSPTPLKALRAEGVVLQTDWWTCGAAALATLHRLLGLPAEEGEMLALALRHMGDRDPRAGLTALALARASAERGLPLRGFRLDPQALQTHFARGGLPLVLHVTRPEPFGVELHFEPGGGVHVLEAALPEGSVNPKKAKAQAAVLTLLQGGGVVPKKGLVEAIIREANVHRKTAERYLAEIAHEAGLVAVNLPGKGNPVAYRLPEAPPLPGEPEPSQSPILHAPATPKWENPDAHRKTFGSTPPAPKWGECS